MLLSAVKLNSLATTINRFVSCLFSVQVPCLPCLLRQSVQLDSSMPTNLHFSVETHILHLLLKITGNKLNQMLTINLHVHNSLFSVINLRFLHYRKQIFNQDGLKYFGTFAHQSSVQLTAVLEKQEKKRPESSSAVSCTLSVRKGDKRDIPL